MASVTVDNGFDEQSLRALVDELVAAGDGERSHGTFESKAHPARVTAIYALTSHTYRLAAAVATLYDAGLNLQCIPLIRSAYEAALHVAWIQGVDDALPAYMNRNKNQLKALRDTILNSGWEPPDPEDPGIPADEIDPYLVSPQSRDAAKNVGILCDDLAMGSQAYAIYRGLSWYTHPTAMVADRYARLADGEDVPRLFKTPSLEDDFMTSWLHVLCSALVWTATSLNTITSDRKDTGVRTRLRQAARTLHIPERLQVTPEARFRGEKAERARLRAAK